MSESSLPIDHAWSVVRRDPDKIEKIDPITAGFALAALGTGAYNAGVRGRNPIADGSFRSPIADGALRNPIADLTLRNPLYFADEARVADPTGLLYDETIENPTGGQRALAGASQAVPIGAAGALVNRGRTGVRSLRAADRAAAESHRARRLASAQRADDAAQANLRNLQQSRRATHRGGGASRATDAEIDEAYRIAEDSAMQLRGAQRYARGTPAAGQAGRGIGSAALVGAGGLGLGLGLRAGEFAIDQFGNMFGDGSGQDSGFQSGFGQQGQTQGFGSGRLGINDISNVQSNAVAGRQIFNPGAYRDDPRAVSFEGQQEFRGFGTTKGENMFVNNTGEEIRKQVEELMDKAHCTSELKADEDKKGKKPAHGMVIVIGSKAGPGPSKNGKRQKLDSEKKED